MNISREENIPKFTIEVDTKLQRICRVLDFRMADAEGVIKNPQG